MPAVRRVTTVDKIADALRTGILHGTLYPGEHLCQHTLAREHTASKVPVREALMQLHTEGLLQHDRNRGYFVLRLSRSEAQQIFLMRRWLETQLLNTLCWPCDLTLDNFSKLQACVAAPWEKANRAFRYDALVQLRYLLFGLSPDKVLLREATRLWMRIDRLHAFFAPEGTYAFTGALASRDRDLLLKAHSAERDHADELLNEAQVALPGIWAEEP